MVKKLVARVRLVAPAVPAAMLALALSVNWAQM